MCANDDHDPEPPATTPELPDVNKIKANLWTVTGNTKQVSDLCEKFEGLFSTEEKLFLRTLEDEQVKNFSFYAKLLRDENSQHQSLLLNALRATGNEQIAEQIKLTHFQANRSHGTSRKTRKPLTITGHKSPAEDDRLSPAVKPRRIHYEILGKSKLYANPESLKIARSLQHSITNLTLSDLQISILTLKQLLRPCLLLGNLDLQNVTFTCAATSLQATPSINLGLMGPDATLILPQLKSYRFSCDNDCSVFYPWESIFFFALFGNRPSNLLNFWRCQLKIEVSCRSMALTMTENKVNFKLPKKEFYDSPHFVPYVDVQTVRSFLKEVTGIDTLVCALPKNFDNLHLTDLPNDLKNLSVSGVNIQYGECHTDDEDQNCCKFYKSVEFDNCQLSTQLLDDISVVFPLATSVQLKDCQLEGIVGADVNIFLT